MVRKLLDTTNSDAELIAEYNIKSSGSWKLPNARKRLRKEDWNNNITKCIYRPFDFRYCYLSNSLMDRPRNAIFDNVVGKENLVLNLARIVKLDTRQHVLIANHPCTAISMDINGSYVFPLYIYRVNIKKISFPMGMGVQVPPPANIIYLPNLLSW